MIQHLSPIFTLLPIKVSFPQPQRHSIKCLQAFETVRVNNGGLAIPATSENRFGSVVCGWVDTNGYPHEKTLGNVGAIEVDKVWEGIVGVVGLLPIS